MDEKKIMDEIKKSADEIPVPDSLKPENMKQKLDDQKKGKLAGLFSGRYGELRRYAIHAAEAAAVIALVFAAGHQVGITEGRVIEPIENAAWSTEGEQTDAAQENAVQTSESARSGAAQEETMRITDGIRMEIVQGETDAAEKAQETEEAQNKEEIDDMMLENPPMVAKVPQAVKKTVHEEGISPVGSEDELYKILKDKYDQISLYRYSDLMMVADGAQENLAEDTGAVAMDSAPVQEQDIIPAGGETGAGYSETNLRELGVDEGDLVKTDGEYIYIMKRDSSVKIIRADGTEMALITALEPENLSESVRDMYVSGNTLVMVTGGSRTSMVESGKDVYVTKSYNYAKTETYDITDRSAPKRIGSAEQEGNYRSSRKAGDYIYLFTQYRPQIEDTRVESEIMPLVNGEYLEADDIYVPESLEYTDYLVIGSVNLNDPSKTVSHKAVVSGADNFYVSSSSIFIYNQSYATGEQKTEILKFGYEDGQIWGVGACSVQGYLNDTFSIDEYKNNLRVLATRWDSQNINSLYVFDEKMQPIGKIDDIAPGETIRSARFMGDTGYFVTFRNTDPLFSVDLSDPSNPKILGELKVTGFSSYLHDYGDGKLLGIGYEADEETGMNTGVKLSMFDVSDPANVKEIKRYTIKDAEYVPALSNYKAVMISPQKNLFGFVCDGNYLVFTYDAQDGFRNLLSYNLMEGEDESGGYYWYKFEDVRGLFIEDTFYLTDTGEVRAFDMTKEFAQEAKLEM